MKNLRPFPAALLVSAVLGSLLPPGLARADLALDTGFDTDGIAQVDFDTGPDAAAAVAVEADGQLVLAGTSRQTADGSTLDYAALVRVDGTTGALDGGFGASGRVSFLPGGTATSGGGAVARAVLIQPADQRILVAGTWKAGPAAATQVYIARLGTDGILDDTFGTDGVVLLTPAGVTNPAANALGLRSDGSIIVAGGGAADEDDEAGVAFIAGVDSAGDPIPGFTGTVVPNPLEEGAGFTFNDLVILDGDGILAAGGGGDLTLVRFTSAGVPDGGFATNGIATFNYFTFDTADGPSFSTDAINELVVLDDGRILIAGQSVAGATLAVLARLTAAGTLDATFGSGGYAALPTAVSNGPATGLVVRPSGDIVLSGSGFKPVQVSPQGIAQSQLPGTFALGVNDLAVLPGGDVVAAGLRNVAGDDTAFGVARFTASDLADGPDTVPDPFVFVTQTGLETDSPATSNAVTIQGIDAPAAITVTPGDDYSIGCTADFTSAAGTIANGQTVCVRTTTTLDGNSDKRAFLTVGNVLGQFAVITGDALPDQFTFVDQTGVPLATPVVSAPITLAGLAIRTDVSVSGGQFSVGCTATYTQTTTEVDPGAQICVRHTSAATSGTQTSTTLTVGKGETVSDVFTSTTSGDITPDPFTFVDQTGVARSTAITSAPVTLAGFTSNAPITVSGGQYSIGCTANFTATAGTVAPGATVCVRHTSSAAGGTATNTVLTVGGSVSDTFTSTTEGSPDTTPDAFSFASQTGVPLATVVTSGAIAISGFDTAASISVSGGTYSKNCSTTFTSAASTLAPGQTVCVRHTSASVGAADTVTILTVGGVNGSFTSTTVPGDAVPAPFSFPSQTGVELITQITSAPVTITGLGIASPITVEGGEYSIGCTSSFTSAQGVISNGQSVCVRHQSSFNSNEAVETVLTIGTESGSFTSTTRTGDQLPDPFSFASQDNVARNTRVVSAPVTFTGFDSTAGILLSGPTGAFGIPRYGFSRGCTGTDVGADDDQLLEPGETICVSVISADADLTSVVVTVTVGGNGVGNRQTATFTVTTGETTPDAFFFQDQVGVPVLTTIYAAPVTITGISGPSNVSISANGQYQVNCTGTWTGAPGVVEDGDTVCVRHVSSPNLSSQVNTTLTVGGVSDVFTTTTTADPKPLPGGSAVDPLSLLLLGPLLAWRRRRHP